MATPRVGDRREGGQGRIPSRRALCAGAAPYRRFLWALDTQDELKPVACCRLLQMVSEVVRECRGNVVPQTPLDLRLHELRASFCGAEFELQDLPEQGYMELIVYSARPRNTAEQVLVLVRKAIDRTVPGLKCALAVPTHNEAEQEADLVLVECLDKYVKACGVVTVIGRRPALASNEAAARALYELWQPSVPYIAVVWG